MAAYFTEDVRGDVQQGMQFAFSLVDEIDISDIEIVVLSESEGLATVRLKCWVKTTAFEKSEEGAMDETLAMVKEDGAWLINNFDMFD